MFKTFRSPLMANFQTFTICRIPEYSQLLHRIYILLWGRPAELAINLGHFIWLFLFGLVYLVFIWSFAELNFFRFPKSTNIQNFPFDFDGNFLIFYDPKDHRIYILSLDRILDRDLSQEDLLDRSSTFDLNPDLPDPPALLLLNPSPPDNPSDPVRLLNPSSLVSS
jgi:hypothetical protein